MSERENKTPDRDDIGTLIRIAEPHADVPADRTARVRAAAHAHWTREVAGQRRSWIGWSLAAAAAIVAVVAFTIGVGRGLPEGTTAPVVAQVEQLEGRVEVTTNGLDSWRVLEQGETVAPGEDLRTIEGRVSLRLDSGHSVRVDRNGHLGLRERGGLELTSGRVYVDSGRQGQDAPVELHTPFGVVREIGTQYEAGIDENGLRLRLREGSVVLRGDTGEQTVTAGNELRVSAARGPEIAAIETHGATWDWVSEIVGVPDFNGASADSFLRWIARERGWTLVFADVDVAEATRDALIEGDLAGFSPEEALQVVTTTSRLLYAIEAGELRVRGEPDLR